MIDSPGAPTSSEPVLRIDDLSVGFDAGRRLTALSHVSLAVGRAEIVGVVGESGCGKSLTALSIMGLLPHNASVTGGSIFLDGIDLQSLNERQKRDLRGRRMSMVFQEPMVALNPLMRVGRQVTEVLTVHGLMNRSGRKERTMALFREVGLPDPAARYRQYPHQLSGGMRQRVMIAMALAAEPSLLIADEPTTALDPTVQSQILDIFLDIRNRLGTAVLLVTHDMGVIAEVVDQVTVMYAGRVVESASVEEIFHRPAHPYTAGLLACIPASNPSVPDSHDLPTIPGRVPALGELVEGCPFAPRCERAQPRCSAEEPALLKSRPGHLTACWYPIEQSQNTMASRSES